MRYLHFFSGLRYVFLCIKNVHIIWSHNELNISHPLLLPFDVSKSCAHMTYRAKYRHTEDFIIQKKIEERKKNVLKAHMSVA